MELETPGGAIASSFFEALIDKLSSAETMDENLHSRLITALFSINVVADDAEKKQIDNFHVKEWLLGVKDGVLDAQDLVEEIHIQVSKSKQEVDESQTSSTRTNQLLGMLNVSPSSIDKNIVSRLKEIVQKLESLVSLKDVLLLNVNHGFNTGSRMLISPSFPSMNSPMYGRNDDQTTLSNWLKSQDKKLSVISMVGMGGIGKTTLAQHLYNDPMIVERFHVRAWVNMSQDFDVCRITRVILESIAGSVKETTNQSILQEKLKEQLIGKKFFIVLDSVWIQDRMKWRRFKTPFTYRAQGSKILVTTRGGEVASVTTSDQIHQLHHLDEEDSWTLFAKHAFHGFDDSYAVSWTKKTTLHEKVGKKVADKCKGLPLALIAIGNLLRRNSSLRHWEKISESDAWDLAEGTRIVPALMVSYQSLPTHLKKCFEYCALFPKGYLYEKDQLCLLWMAENLIQRPRQHMTSMKEVAESYFNDLILRSFFQPSTKYRNYFVMHDLHHDLSKSIFGEFCFTWEGRKSKNMTSITRHFSFLCDEIGSPKGLETLFDAKKLRTFLPLSMTCFEYQWLLCFNSNKLLLSELFSKCKRLRVLSLCGCMDMIELPDNIGNLKHLHHLDLSRTKISKLPDTLCSLHYLQTLKVRDCQFLEELPMNLHKLVNLCYLDFSGTKVTVMPKEMGKLKNLEVLSSFYVGKGNDSSIQQLGDLNLHGNLVVADLENVMNPEDSVSANLERKINLLKLELRWNATRNSSQKEREVLQNLKPSIHLNELSIEKYCGTLFPHWFGDNSLSRLVSLKLSNCENCILLPSLGVMSSLKHLRITGLSGIVVIGMEFYRDGRSSTVSIPFPSLETLTFKDMNGWEKWEFEVVKGVVFPRLKKLSIMRCPNLKDKLPETLECLVSLKICDCKQLVTSVPFSPSISELRLTNCGKLKFNYHLSTLKFLYIRQCYIEGSSVDWIRHTLSECGTNIKSLKIEDCATMHIPLCGCYNFLVKLDITSSCDSLTTFPLNLFPNLDFLDLYKCSSFEMISQENEHLKLTSLSIGECPKFASFPKGGLSTPSWSRSPMEVCHQA
ncbi:putative disease resistance RPP13-like protein 1 [Medicago truncatula]|uniref:putative disease resistance RPP13-like protein 1 n=1 Tax=Medicago truncatula TaxID=3880 RepID=UPI0019684592|nr:putative disease resistance RPP13-like protein 1 [Medicago truncatula]